MNYLAHMFLSCNDEEWIIGNFISDFITNKEKLNYSAGIQKGIAIHRFIDNFTDTHPQVHIVNALIRPVQGKYAPVMTDIYFDYFLIKHWNLYSVTSISDYIQHVYDVLEKYIDTYPQQLQSIVPIMIRDNFLMACENEERLRKTFQRVANRTRFENHMDKAYDNLVANYNPIQDAFIDFFSELIQKSQQFCES